MNDFTQLKTESDIHDPRYGYAQLNASEYIRVRANGAVDIAFVDASGSLEVRLFEETLIRVKLAAVSGSIDAIRDAMVLLLVSEQLICEPDNAGLDRAFRRLCGKMERRGSAGPMLFRNHRDDLHAISVWSSRANPWFDQQPGPVPAMPTPTLRRHTKKARHDPT